MLWNRLVTERVNHHHFTAEKTRLMIWKEMFRVCKLNICERNRGYEADDLSIL